MRIVHVYDGHERVYGGRRGSVPTVLWNVAKQAAALGHEVTVVERQWEGTEQRTTHEGVSFRRIALGTGSDTPWEEIPYEMVSSAVGATKLVVDRTNFALRALRTLPEDVDVIHVHLPFAANVLVTIAPWLRDKTVYTAHIGEEEGRLSMRVSPDVYLASRVRRTTVMHRSVLQAFEREGVPRDKLVHIGNGVDTNRFGSGETTAHGYAEPHETLVLFVGTVTPRKGVLELVEAAAALVEEYGHDDVHFVVVGDRDLDPEYVERVESKLRAEGLTDSVTLTGFVSDEELLALYDDADVFVSASYQEGSPMVVNEAMAAGTPVVGTAVGGIPDRVEDGENGFLVEPGDPDALVSALDPLLHDAEKRTHMAERARERAREFDWEAVTERYLDVYREGVQG